MRFAPALIAVIVLAVLGVLLWSTAIGVARSAGTNVRVIAARRAGGDLVTMGRSVNVQSEIQGDVAAAGSSVTIAQPVRGYAMAAGSVVVVRGEVDDDLWAAGADLEVDAPVRDNAMLAGGTVTLGEQASIGGNAAIAGRTVDVRGPIGGDLQVAAEQVKLGGEIGGSVTARAARLSVLPGASIQGDLVVNGPNAPEVSEDGQVLGRIEFHRDLGSRAWGPLAWLGRWAFMLLSSLILGTLVIALGAAWPERVADQLRRNPVRALAFGAR